MEDSKKLTFPDCMGRVTDPRKPYNQLHVFLDIKEWLSTFLTLENGIPSHDTFNRVFQLINPEEFHSIFLEWIQEAVKGIKGVVSIDGKTVRRSRDGKNKKRQSMLSVHGPGSSRWSSDRKKSMKSPMK